ncbi:hypothetical protein PInf_011564 [Phytophthora infestans]|nr:hypothetical protein PInf_011564 [Phytophthora infestans]
MRLVQTPKALTTTRGKMLSATQPRAPALDAAELRPWRHVERHRGVCVICNIFLFASPLETLGKVIRTKSAASLPIELCVANLVAGALWSALAIGQNDMFVLTPNALGTMLGALQVALYLVYPPRFQAVLRPERSRPLPIITSTSKPDELSIKVAVQGPVFCRNRVP